MKCERCDKDATVHLTQVVEGHMQKMHLCPDCASELGVTEEAGFSVADVLLGQGNAKPLGRSRSRVCPECGLSFSRFRKQGRLGCPACYESFSAELEPILQSMHDATEHTGRRPRHLEARLSLHERAEVLECRLADAVAEEKYEEAARLRDELQQLQPADHSSRGA